MTPTLIAWSQAASTDAGRDSIRALVAQLGALLPGVRIEEAFAALHEPSLTTAVAAAVAEGPAIVVPLMLSTRVQDRADIARAVGAHPGLAFAAPALGPHDLLALVLESRVLELGIDGDDAVVLAAEGDCERDAALDVEHMASPTGAVSACAGLGGVHHGERSHASATRSRTRGLPVRGGSSLHATFSHRASSRRSSRLPGRMPSLPPSPRTCASLPSWPQRYRRDPLPALLAA